MSLRLIIYLAKYLQEMTDNRLTGLLLKHTHTHTADFRSVMTAGLFLESQGDPPNTHIFMCIVFSV